MTVKILPFILMLCVSPLTFSQTLEQDERRCHREAMLNGGGPAAAAMCRMPRTQRNMQHRVEQMFPSKKSTANKSSQTTVQGKMPSNSSRAANLVDNLSKLSDMYEKGLLTEEEFQQAKRAALGLD